jgi:hypothetical protein
MTVQPLLATGKVESLSLNGNPTQTITFALDGPMGDAHRKFARQLSGHDGGYIRSSALQKGARMFNWRSWTGLAVEEIAEMEQSLGCTIPQGCLLENITVSGIPNFSQLTPASRLVFPHRPEEQHPQAILAVWEENGPCKTVGQRLEDHHQRPGLKTDFVAAAQGKRGVMGFVLAAGHVAVGDQVLVYSPVS